MQQRWRACYREDAKNSSARVFYSNACCYRADAFIWSRLFVLFCAFCLLAVSCASCSLLSCLVLSCLVVSCPVLLCPVLYCLVVRDHQRSILFLQKALLFSIQPQLLAWLLVILVTFRLVAVLFVNLWLEVYQNMLCNSAQCSHAHQLHSR